MYDDNKKEHELLSKEQEVHCFLTITPNDKKGKGGAEEIKIGLKELEKFYARKFKDIHLDQ